MKLPRPRLSFLALCAAFFFVRPAAAAEERALVLDNQRSTIEVQVHATFDSFAGKLSRFRTDIAVDPEQQRTTRARLSFDFADLQTGRERRNHDMLVWTDHDRFPSVEFEMESLEPTPGGPAMVRGNLMLHGITHAVAFPVSFLTEGSLYAIDGEVVIDYRDYGLPVIRKFYILTVDPSLRIRFHLQGKLVPAVSGL